MWKPLLNSSVIANACSFTPNTLSVKEDWPPELNSIIFCDSLCVHSGPPQLFIFHWIGLKCVLSIQETLANYPQGFLEARYKFQPYRGKSKRCGGLEDTWRRKKMMKLSCKGQTFLKNHNFWEELRDFTRWREFKKTFWVILFSKENPWHELDLGGLEWNDLSLSRMLKRCLSPSNSVQVILLLEFLAVSKRLQMHYHYPLSFTCINLNNFNCKVTEN